MRCICSGELGICVQLGLGLLDSAIGFETADPFAGKRAGQPERSRKRGSVVEQWEDLGDRRETECATCDDDEEDITKSEIFIPLTLEVKGIDEENEVMCTGRNFYLADVEAFLKGPCAVIPNIGGKPNAYLQVKSRGDWIQLFEDWLKQPRKDDEMED